MRVCLVSEALVLLFTLESTATMTPGRFDCTLHTVRSCFKVGHLLPPIHFTSHYSLLPLHSAHHYLSLTTMSTTLRPPKLDRRMPPNLQMPNATTKLAMPNATTKLEHVLPRGHHPCCCRISSSSVASVKSAQCLVHHETIVPGSNCVSGL